MTDGNLNFIIDNLSRVAEFMLERGIANNDLFEYSVVYFFNQSSSKFVDFNTAKLEFKLNKVQRLVKFLRILADVNAHSGVS